MTKHEIFVTVDWRNSRKIMVEWEELTGSFDEVTEYLLACLIIGRKLMK